MVYGVGVYERGEFPAYVCGRQTKEYVLWKGMLERCYSDKLHARKPSYVGCSVSEDFKFFQEFARWANRQVIFGEVGVHLDKDLLVKGNKVYSPETCVLVPKDDNLLLTKREAERGLYPIGVSLDKGRGLYAAEVRLNGKKKNLGRFPTPEDAFASYKTAKEAQVRAVAEKFKDSLDPRAYVALQSYQVELTD
jgi:hypothetical protein